MTQTLPLGATQAAKPNRQQRRQARKNAKKLLRASGAKRDTANGPLMEKFAEAARLQEAGQLLLAEPLFREILAEDPEHKMATFRLGCLLAQGKRFDEAVALFERAREMLPDYAPVHRNLGTVYTAKGCTDSAAQSMRRAYDLEAGNPEAGKAYGKWCLTQGRTSEAIEALRKCLAMRPGDAQTCQLLAAAYSNLKRFAEAAKCFEQALEIEPGNEQIRLQLGAMLLFNGQQVEALPYLARVLAEGHRGDDAQRLFGAAIADVQLKAYSEEIEKALLVCFEDEITNLSRLSTVAGFIILQKYGARARVEEETEGGRETGRAKLHLDGILADPLLIELLRKSVNRQMALDPILSQIRRSLIMTAREQGGLNVAHLRFMAAFAMQCRHNSYVYSVSEPEAQRVETLAEELEHRLGQGETPNPDLEIALALFAMYRPLYSLPSFERLLGVPLDRWSAELRPLIELSLIYPTEEQELKKGIPGFGSIEDETSKAVRSQYEENPYPRWTSMPMITPVTFRDSLVDCFPWLDPAPDRPEGPDILIAGCGTGQHPISRAKQLPGARLLAIDLSLSSLAYAKRMALRLGVENLEFRHGDILDVAELGQDFDAIESAGVLHHMKQPEAGLAALLKILKPGGYLRLGLYSGPARQWITKARMRIKELGLAPTADNIRRFREQVMMGREPDLERYARMGDFFDLDSFRDLVFHVQEHVYTIPELEDMMARHGLEFLGFVELKPNTIRDYRERFPQDVEMRDLGHWAEFESLYPDTFIGMYQFWCRRAG